MAVPPMATYRVQLHAEFGFDAAAAVVPYLRAIGVTHLYSSPCLEAAPDSLHGYDVVDPSRVSTALGGAAAHGRLGRALQEHGLGQLLDIVPNHMAIRRENPWWWDVLEHGPASRYASYFDVDWSAPERSRDDVVLLPVLDDHYGRVLEAGRIRLVRDGQSLRIVYEDHVFPVRPGSLEELVPAGGAGGDHTVPDEAIERINADPDRLDALLGRQHYRLAYWRLASRELDYRRFFDVSSLIALRVEREEVFHAVHATVLDWLASGAIDGLRIDHIDGLYDPLAYLARLAACAPQAWIVVEKILEAGERLPKRWPVAGTTGYDFMNVAGGLFVDSRAESSLTALYAGLTGEPTDFAELRHDKKSLVLDALLGADLNRLTTLLERIAARHRRFRDFTRRELADVLRGAAAAFPVYRSYVRRAREREVSADDERHVTEAIKSAQRRCPDPDPELFDFVRDILLLRYDGDAETELAMRFQQLTGPVMAKGVEDTAFYCYNRFVALNEVGGSPERFGVTLDAFHDWARTTACRYPQALLATSTHDTKRSEDVRMRLALLSEIPKEWSCAVREWFDLNAGHWCGTRPDRNAEYLLYQTLVGAWPIAVERVRAYMQKAVREAKQRTSWTRPDEAYERALASFIDAVTADQRFTAALDAFVAPMVAPGRVNSLAFTLLKLTAPGVPDIYQGTELWDFSLVDPDNRRPVDYALRARLLGELDTLTPAEIVARADDGLPKLWLIREALALRRRQPEAFGTGAGYGPLEAEGAVREHVVAYLRAGQVAAVAPRLPITLARAGGWRDTAIALPPGRWRNVLGATSVGDGRVGLAELLAPFPVALLIREDARV
jgi:(1->4)-alpha-D-glucan 1-alpha-D-glucosylmutase